MDRCPNLVYLNICGLSSVTDTGVKAICANEWYLKYLNMEDIFLLNDAAFWFDVRNDGRQAADEKMLTQLNSLILKDCVHLSDNALSGLELRCHKISYINLQGCHKLTNAGLCAMYGPTSDSVEGQFPMCDSFKEVNLAACNNFTFEHLTNLFEKCGVLENLNLSALTAVNDRLIENLCRLCPTVQILVLQRCTFITDSSLCHMARHLWLEHLDISYCSKITDTGIEILTVACNGLLSLTAKRVRRITNRSINFLLKHCKLIRSIDVSECESIDKTALMKYSSGESQLLNVNIVF